MSRLPISEWTHDQEHIFPSFPPIDEFPNKLHGAKIFMKLDVRWGYNSVWIKLGDERKGAFITKRGLFQLTVMFFGMINLPATFTRGNRQGSCSAVVWQLISIRASLPHVASVWRLCRRIWCQISGPLDSHSSMFNIFAFSQLATCTWMEQRSRVILKRGPMKWEACKVCDIANVSLTLELTFTVDCNACSSSLWGSPNSPLLPMPMSSRRQAMRERVKRDES